MTICGLTQNCVGVGMKLYYFNYLLTSRKECQLLNLLTSRKECTPLHSFLPVLATREIRGLNSVGVHKEQCLCILLGGRSFLPVYITVLGGYTLSCQLPSERQECRGSYTLSCLLVNWEERECRGIHSFFPVRFGKAFVWGYTLSCQLVNWEGRVHR